MVRVFRVPPCALAWPSAHPPCAAQRPVCDGRREDKSCPAAPASQHKLQHLNKLSLQSQSTSQAISQQSYCQAPHSQMKSLAAQFARSGTVCSVAFFSFSFPLNIAPNLLIFPSKDWHSSLAEIFLESHRTSTD